MYHTTTFSKIYSDSPPDLTLLGELKVQELILPEFKRTSGHSKKHQEHSQYKDIETERRKYACHSCGGFGHQKRLVQNQVLNANSISLVKHPSIWLINKQNFSAED